MPPNTPPPVRPSAVGAPRRTAEENYLTIVATLKSNNGAEAKAIRAMFGGDKRLMDRFLAVAFSLLAKDSDLLQRASPMSIIESIKTAASMGLEPMTDDGAIVVRSGVAQFQPMYRGYLKRIRNSGKVMEVDCQLVYENDFFELGLGTDPFIKHIPAATMKDAQTGEIISDRGGYRGAYAWALMPSGIRIIEWMEEAEINRVRDQFGQTHSRDGRPLPWATSYGEMARKTVIRRLAKRLPAAAVDTLLQADARLDDAEAELRRSQEDHMGDLRRLAMQAVGSLPAGDVPAAPVAEPEPSPAPQPPRPDDVARGELATGDFADLLDG